MPREFNAKRMLTLGGTIFLIVLIVGYGVWISRDILFGITSKVYGVTDGMSVHSSVLELDGKARHASKVTLNGRAVAIDQKGIWGDTVALLPGYNILTVAATDKFGRSQAKSFRVYYTAPKGVQ